MNPSGVVHAHVAHSVNAVNGLQPGRNVFLRPSDRVELASWGPVDKVKTAMLALVNARIITVQRPLQVEPVQVDDAVLKTTRRLVRLGVFMVDADQTSVFAIHKGKRGKPVRLTVCGKQFSVFRHSGTAVGGGKSAQVLDLLAKVDLLHLCRPVSRGGRFPSFLACEVDSLPAAAVVVAEKYDETTGASSDEDIATVEVAAGRSSWCFCGDAVANIAVLAQFKITPIVQDLVTINLFADFILDPKQGYELSIIRPRSTPIPNLFKSIVFTTLASFAVRPINPTFTFTPTTRSAATLTPTFNLTPTTSTSSTASASTSIVILNSTLMPTTPSYFTFNSTLMPISGSATNTHTTTTPRFLAGNPFPQSFEFTSSTLNSHLPKPTTPTHSQWKMPPIKLPELPALNVKVCGFSGSAAVAAAASRSLTALDTPKRKLLSAADFLHPLLALLLCSRHEAAHDICWWFGAFDAYSLSTLGLSSRACTTLADFAQLVEARREAEVCRLVVAWPEGRFNVELTLSDTICRADVRLLTVEKVEKPNSLAMRLLAAPVPIVRGARVVVKEVVVSARRPMRNLPTVVAVIKTNGPQVPEHKRRVYDLGDFRKLGSPYSATVDASVARMSGGQGELVPNAAGVDMAAPMGSLAKSTPVALVVEAAKEQVRTGPETSAVKSRKSLLERMSEAVKSFGRKISCFNPSFSDDSSSINNSICCVLHTKLLRYRPCKGRPYTV